MTQTRLRLVTPPPANPAPTGYVTVSRAAALRMSSVAAKVHAAQRAFAGSFSTAEAIERVKADLRMAQGELAIVLRDLEAGQ